MLIKVADNIRKKSEELLAYSEKYALLRELKDVYNIKVPSYTYPEYVGLLLESLRRIPADLVKDCGVTIIAFDDLGPSKEYFPNHGRYSDGAFILNEQILDDPFLETDLENGSCLNKLDQTLYHEMGHGLDEKLGGGEGKEMCMKPDWMGLSGWSKEPKPGLKKLIIRDPGCPVMEGEYFYSPDAGFPRFYGKRNPWDDWADSFAYYVGGLKSFLPQNKLEYFGRHLTPYYQGKN